MRDLARTIELDNTTKRREGHKFLREQTAKELRIQFGRDKRSALLNLSKWYRNLHLTKSERDLLHQIIHRSNQDAPWEYDTRKYGPNQIAEEFGFSERSFYRAVASLTRKGDLIVVSINRSRKIYRVPETMMNAIRGRGNVVPLPMPSLPKWQRTHKSEAHPCNEESAPVLGSEDVRQGRYISSSNSNSSSRDRQKAFLLKKSAAVATLSQQEHIMEHDDDGPVLGADPDKPQTPSGSTTAWFADYFEQAWERVEPKRRETELNWPQKPWSVGKKTAFMGWAARTLLPGYQHNRQLMAAMVDEFCDGHSVYFSPYGGGPVWKQFNKRLDRIRAKVVREQPELSPEPAGQDEPDVAIMERYREREARDEARRASGVPRKPSGFRG